MNALLKKEIEQMERRLNKMWGGCWTREKPTEPGYYKAIIHGSGNVRIIEVKEDANFKGRPLRAYLVGREFSISFVDISWWWSDPENLPDPPKILYPARFNNQKRKL